MKFLFLLMSLISLNAQAEFPVNCQVQALNVAQATYTDNFKQFTDLFAIKYIRFEATENNRVKVVYSGVANPFNQDTKCSLHVYLDYPTEDEDIIGCPRYFHKENQLICD